MLLAQTSSRSLRRSLPSSTSTSRALSSSFSSCFPRNRPYVASEATRRTLGSLTGFRTRPPHQDSASSSSAPFDESAEARRTWNRLLPSTWASKFVRSPTSRIGTSALSSDPPPPPAPPPSSSSTPPSASPPPAEDSPTPSSAPAASSSSTCPPPPPVTPELPSEEHLRILQSTIADSLHVGRHLHGRTALSSRRSTVEPPEPIVGVYCPLEGGSYVLDAGMDEIAARLGADLVHLDAIELAAEGTGQLGPATSAIPLSPNPLKIRGANPSSGISATTDSSGTNKDVWEQSQEEQEDEEDEDGLDMDEFDDDEYESRPARGSSDSATDHTLSSSRATRGNDWHAGAMSVVDTQSTGPAADPTPPADEVEEVNDQPPASPFTSSPFFPAPEQLKKERTKPSPPSSQEVLARLFSEIVNAEQSPSTVDLASPSLDETSLLPTDTPVLPTLANDSSKPRIIYIKNAILMSSTFSTTSTASRPSWFHELLTAVRSRRYCHGPTTIVLGLTPSVLLTATSPSSSGSAAFMSFMAEKLGAPSPSPSAMSDSIPWAASSEARPAPAKEVALMSRMTQMRNWQWGSLLPSFEGGQNGGSSGSPLDGLGRRLSALPPPMFPLGLPSGGAPGGGGVSMAFQVLPALLGGSPSAGKSGGDDAAGNKTIWKVVGVVPRVREPAREKATRYETRAQINDILFRIGAKTSQATLEGSIPTVEDEPAVEEAAKETPSLLDSSTTKARTLKYAQELLKDVDVQLSAADKLFLEGVVSAGGVEDGTAIDALKSKSDGFEQSLRLVIYPWDGVVHLSGLAAGQSIANKSAKPSVSPDDSTSAPSPPALPPRPATTSSPSSTPSKPSYTWDDLRTAFLARAEADELFKKWIGENPDGPKAASSTTGSGEKADGTAEPVAKPDPVVEAVKNDPKLTKHEQKIIGTIVDPKAIRDSFQDVHLPEKTVDAIRSVVSLPLLFPEAFSTGILKNHSTTGALLFGPPGTGKTLLVRALAKESGARMMAIQPSDVMDMYFGEAEKLVKAVFKIARRLAPCIIFVDEIDALFQARSGGGGGSGGDSARRQMLTEFMQEMDGLNSAASNREKGLIMIGATNRPQDLDEAVLRRLPRRLMIDLPGPKEREAILNILLRTETLGPDVDLKQLAKDTPSYSGSDLKHLCVVAAQEAVKELYTVPWAKKAAATSISSSPSPSTPTPAPAPTTDISPPAPPAPPATYDPVQIPSLDPAPSPDAPTPPPTATASASSTDSSSPTESSTSPISQSSGVENSSADGSVTEVVEDRLQSLVQAEQTAQRALEASTQVLNKASALERFRQEKFSDGDKSVDVLAARRRVQDAKSRVDASTSEYERAKDATRQERDRTPTRSVPASPSFQSRPPVESQPSTSHPSTPTASLTQERPSSHPTEESNPAPSSDNASTTLLPLENKQEGNAVVVEDTTSAGKADAPAPVVDAKPEGKKESKVKPRVLTAHHFKIALANSSSSGSEEVGALPELRKWNEQFGDAGTKKNKKSGFGKGFGFGEKEDKDKKKDGGKTEVVK